MRNLLEYNLGKSPLTQICLKRELIENIIKYNRLNGATCSVSSIHIHVLSYYESKTFTTKYVNLTETTSLKSNEVL